ncbi:uncharacterized protein LOC142783990 [Rhipicephalus microplus]|uniref:uncharacterized protein LOC142783990 n=1 Tax=Rhipicephalus microplus TaxID=6941 RepID=UPI003F6BEEE0
MPSNAELAKKIEALESLVRSSLDTLANELTAKIKEKLAQEGLGEHASLSDSVQFLCDSFDSIKTKQNELKLANKELVAQNEALTRRVAELEQYSRLNNVEIKGVPVTQGEDCAAIVMQIGEAIQCPVTPSDFDTVHRVSTKSDEKNIVARFCCREKKNDFVRKARKTRPNTSDVGFSGSSSKAIYANDHLSPDNKRLFAKALTLKKAHKWQFLWTDNCQIKARKSGDGRVYRIIKDSDLSIFS